MRESGADNGLEVEALEDELGSSAGFVRDGIDAHLQEALLQVRVPVVLDLIVCAAR